MKGIISYESTIRKFFSETGLAKIFTAKAAGMLAAFLVGMAARGFRGKMIDLRDACGVCRTAFSRLLAGGEWSREDLSGYLKKYVFQYILDIAKSTGQPIYVIIDAAATPSPSLRARPRIPSRARDSTTPISSTRMYGATGPPLRCSGAETSASSTTFGSTTRRMEAR
jgi:hypothetical protein